MRDSVKITVNHGGSISELVVSFSHSSVAEVHAAVKHTRSPSGVGHIQNGADPVEVK